MLQSRLARQLQAARTTLLVASVRGAGEGSRADSLATLIELEMAQVILRGALRTLVRLAETAAASTGEAA